VKRDAQCRVTWSGYDDIELSATDVMREHLVLDRWKELAPEVSKLSKEYGLELLAMEHRSQDPVRTETAFQPAVELGIPIVNCGSGGKSGDKEAWPQVIDDRKGR
jgi:sugar phosphate isomerase/epimerase